MEPDLDGVETQPHDVCLMCDQPCHGGGRLCSRECLLRAKRELEANVIQLRQEGFESEARAALATRNGHLTSALFRWRP
jgi:hypothetical protein